LLKFGNIDIDQIDLFDPFKKSFTVYCISILSKICSIFSW